MENKMIVEVNPEVVTNGVNLLLENAFSNIQDNRDSWSEKNPFSKYLRKVMDEKQGEIKKVLADYVMEVVESEDFRFAVKSEYAKLMAEAMLRQMQKG